MGLRIEGSFSCINTYFVSLLLGVLATPGVAAPVASVTIVRSTPNPAVAGQAVTFTAGVNLTATQFVTGTITLTDTFQGVPEVIGAITLDPTTGAGTLVVSTLVAGLHNIVGSYSGDSNYAPGSSEALQQTILSSFTATTTIFSSSVNPSAVGESVTLSAAVSVSTPNTRRPTGTVTFYDGATELGSATVVNGGGTKTLNSAAFATSALALGSHNIQAVYAGDNVFAGSTSAILVQVVQGSAFATTTVLTPSTTSATAGQPITLTTDVTSVSGTPSGAVEITDGTSTLATVTLDGTGKASLTTSSLSVGTHTLAADYSGDAKFGTSASETVSVLIQPNPLAATTTLLASSVNPSTVASPITLTATVTSASGTPTGTVEFQDGSSVLGTVTLVSGLATLNSVSLTAAGTHLLSAVYGGDSNYAGSSGPLTQVVNSPGKVATTTNLTSSSNPSAYGQTISFKATISGTGGTPSGVVTFTVGTTISQATLDSSGTTVYTTSALPAGTTKVSAAYSGDTTFAGSISALVPQKVNRAPTADSVTPFSGVGTSQTFAFNYSSANGYSYLSIVSALFNSSLSYANGCLIQYRVASNQMYLYPGAGSAWLGPVTPGTAGMLSNSQCTIDAAASSVSGSLNTLTVNAAVTFTPAFRGVKTVYGIAADKGSLNSGWKTLGSWTP
jgi:Bacterial Ig-like domain (group 3)